MIASQVIEHLRAVVLLCAPLDGVSQTSAGAPVVLETINPACWLAFFSSYLRDFTHVWPVHPETLQYLLQAVGFSARGDQIHRTGARCRRMRGVDPASLTGLIPRPAR